MKNILKFFFGVLILSIVLGCIKNKKYELAEDNDFRVGIHQIVNHPALNKVSDSFKKALSEAAEKGGKRVVFLEKNSLGDPTKFSRNNELLLSKDCDLYFVIGTSIAVNLHQKEKKSPIVVGSITDPWDAGLVSKTEKNNVTGTSDMPPVKEQIEMLQSVYPIKKLGVIYNDTEQNSISVIKVLREVCGTEIELMESFARNPNETSTAAENLIRRGVEAIYAPTDNNIQVSLSSLIRVANGYKVPVFNCDIDSVKNGALFSIAVKYETLGAKAGEQAAMILFESVDPNEIDIYHPKGENLFVNELQCSRFGIPLEKFNAFANEIVIIENQ